MGTFTNIILAIKKDSNIVKNLKIISMGGAVFVPGNMSSTDNKVSEANFFMDPQASKLDSGAAKFINKELIALKDILFSGTFYAWDLFAGSFAVDGSYTETQQVGIIIQTGNLMVDGWTKPDPSGTIINVALKTNVENFYQQFAEIIQIPD